MAEPVSASPTASEFFELRVTGFLYSSTYSAIAVNGLLGLLLTSLHWSLFHTHQVLAWYFILILSLIGRGLIFSRYKKRAITTANNKLWLNLFRAGAIATAVVWGMASPLLLNNDEMGLQTLQAFVLGGLTVGAITTLAPDRISYLSFNFILLIPLVISLLLSASSYHIYMAVMVLIFSFAMILYAERIRTNWLENLQLRDQQTAVEQELLLQKQLAEISARAQSSFIHEDDRRIAFNNLLTDLLALTQSQYGFIGEVLQNDKGEPYLKANAITNISWSEESDKLYQENAASGMEFHKLDNLFGAVISSGKMVIANQPESDPRRGGLPAGHPPLNAFLGVPIYHGGKIKGMIGLANRAGGYTASLELFLQPLLTTIGQLIEAAHNHSAKAIAEQALAKQAQHTQTIIDNMIDGLITIDARGLIRVFNPAAEQMFGYSAAEVVGRNVSMLMPSAHAKQHDTYLHLYQTTGIAQIIGIEREVEGLRRNGSCFPMDLSISEINKNGEVEYIGMVRDITERKRLDQLKNEFVSIVSHELRTPLTSISGALGLVAGGDLGELPDLAAKMVRIAHKNSLRLGMLINDLLDMEKLVAGKMHFDIELQPVLPLLKQAIRDNQAYADSYGVQYQLADTRAELSVMVDALRLQQILANFLSNAAKFSPEGSLVQIGAEAVANKIKIYVKDQGPGIPENFKARIFEKFAQADSSDTRQKGGTGLGLAISKELIERMGGTIGFDSIAAEGSCFYVLLKNAH